MRIAPPGFRFPRALLDSDATVAARAPCRSCTEPNVADGRSCCQWRPSARAGHRGHRKARGGWASDDRLRPVAKPHQGLANTGLSVLRPSTTTPKEVRTCL